MISTTLLEPSASDKRRSYSKTLMGPHRAESEPVESVKQRLKDMRRLSPADVDRLADQLRTRLSYDPDVDVRLASDASEAVAEIERISGGTRKVAVGKSGVVAQEIVPHLKSAGFQIINSYLGEFEPREYRFDWYWKLPRMTTETLADSFETRDLNGLRAMSLKNGGGKGFVGVLGVNAISADDGSVFLMQHLHNIDKIFRHAKALVMVVGLDKICRDRSEALFQTMCMGLFGWDVRLLGLGSSAIPEANLDAIPPGVPRADCDLKLHVIILDNGRRKLLKTQYKDLFTCIGCRACVRSCPTQKFFGEMTEWSPKEYLYSMVQGQNRSVALCLGCGMCRVECPIGIDIPAMMLRAQHEYSRPHSVAGALLGNFETMARLGSRMPGVSNTVLNSGLPRWFAEKTVGIQKDVKMPRFTGETLPGWFRSRRSGT